MELSRRDALLALGTLGVSTYAGGQIWSRTSDFEEVSTLTAIAEVIYPTEVTITDEFLSTYVRGRAIQDDRYRRQQTDLLAKITARSRRQYAADIGQLDLSRRDALLSKMGVKSARPASEGTVPERIRYYIINDLLYALYSTPKGGKLAGVENPPGHPGGREAYQSEPERS